MIAVDTSSFVAYLQGTSGPDIDLLDQGFEAKQVMLPPAVVTELLSDPGLTNAVVALIKEIPQLEVTDGYWERAGTLRSQLLRKGCKVRVADALIAQSCLDNKIGLITRDGDFKAMAKICGLLLLK